VLMPIPGTYHGGVCDASATTYTYDRPVNFQTNPAANDASADAVYRLLNESLDQAPPRGIVDTLLDSNKSVQVEGKISAQTLWGPVKMRLVVWS
jgi:hypothetical protein